MTSAPVWEDSPYPSSATFRLPLCMYNILQLSAWQLCQKARKIMETETLFRWHLTMATTSWKVMSMRCVAGMVYPGILDWSINSTNRSQTRYLTWSFAKASRLETTVQELAIGSQVGVLCGVLSFWYICVKTVFDAFYRQSDTVVVDPLSLESHKIGRTKRLSEKSSLEPFHPNKHLLLLG